MTKEQAHTLKLKIAVFAEASAMIEWAKRQGAGALEACLSERDRTRDDLYKFIDELTSEK